MHTTRLRTLAAAGHIRTVEGDGGDGGAGSPTDPPAPTTDDQGTKPPEGSEPQDVASLPEWARKLLTSTREEAAQHRRKAGDAETERNRILTDLGKALGLSKDEAPDPEALAQDLASRDSDLRAARAELAVLKAAGTAGADANALLDSRGFMAAIEGIDPAADDYAKRVAEKITKYVDENPRFKAQAAVPPRGGAPMTDGGKETPPDDMDEFVKLAARNRSKNNLRRP